MKSLHNKHIVTRLNNMTKTNMRQNTVGFVQGGCSAEKKTQYN